MLGDYEEEYSEMRRERGAFFSIFWLWKEIIILVPQYFNNSFFWSLVMFRNYLKIVIRIIFRQKVYSFINISGLAVGLASCILIMLWVQHELSFDSFHENLEQIHMVYNHETYSNGEESYFAQSVMPLADVLKEEYPEFEKVTRIMRKRETIGIGDRSFRENDIILADPEFFDVFSFPIKLGDKVTPLNNKHSIILSESKAEKYFGNENPIGKILTLGNETDYIVTAVTEDLPTNSFIEFEFILPFENIRDSERDYDNWRNWSMYYFVKVQPNSDVELIKSKLKNVYEGRTKSDDTYASLIPMSKVHFYTNHMLGMGNKGEIKYVYIFSIIASFLLLTACINFMNLSTARSAKRAREVGLRKTVGANRKTIIGQFYGESLFIVFLSLLLSIVLAYLTLPYFSDLTAKNLKFSSIFTPEIILIIFSIFLLTGIVAGSYPAIFLSSFKPVNVLRGTFKGGASNSVFRKALVSFQFILVISLIVGSITVNEQLGYIRQKNLGFNKEQKICIPLNKGMHRDLHPFINKLRNKPEIKEITMASDLPSDVKMSFDLNDWEGRTGDEQFLSSILYTDVNFANCFDLKMIEGRYFSKDYLSDSSEAIIVNETFLKYAGMENAIGKKVLDLKIVGVVQDFHFRSLHEKIHPLVLFLFPDYNDLIISVNSINLDSTLEMIKSEWALHAKGTPFEFSFLDEKIDRLYKTDERIEATVNVFTFMILFVGAIGLFGLSSYTAEQRRKEIGVRKVLGASIPGLFALMIREYAKWVLLANIIAWPISYYFMSGWLENFAYRIAVPLMVFPLAGIAALLVAVISVGYQSITAAITNPINSIKYE